jgi:hypothetical protein
MSEAEIPNNSSNLFESNPSQDASQPTEDGICVTEFQAQPDQEWATVDFPDAISVDAIPQASPVALNPNASEPNALDPDRVQVLEQHNHKLQERIADLELALHHSETLLRQETERLETLAGAQYAKAQQRSHEQATLITKQRKDLEFARQRIREQEAQLLQHTQELSVAHDQLAHLLHEVDTAHQTVQKRQILVETLTSQLESSQEQVARLERECALTQQRYTEQVQLTRQAENSCRDLRSRLHRQQRYTLQFKAALERCLDVPAHPPEVVEPAVEAAKSESADSPATLSFDKAPPVQPWSASPGFPAFDAGFEAAFERDQLTLRGSEEPTWTTESLLEDPLLDDPSVWTAESLELDAFQAIAPEEVQSKGTAIVPYSREIAAGSDRVIAPIPKVSPLSYTINRASSNSSDTPRGVHLFNPPGMPPALRPSPEPQSSSPEVKSPGANQAPELRPTVDLLPSEPLTDQFGAANFTSEQFVAEGLADQLNDHLDGMEVMVSEGAELAASGDGSNEARLLESAEMEPVEISPPASQEITSQTITRTIDPPSIENNPFAVYEHQIAQEIVQEIAQGSSPFITLHSTADVKSTLPKPMVEVGSSQASEPSPVVYPARSQRKLPSLAAVDLPSFPRR